MTKHDSRTVDVRVAAALNGGSAAAVISDLILEIEDSLLPQTIKALEAEQSRMLSPTTTAPDRCRQMVDKLELELQRLKAAIPALQARYRELEEHEHCTVWNADYTKVAQERDQLAKELIALYPTMVDKFVDLFKRIEHCDKNADILNRTAPAGEKRRLIGVELTARELDNFTATQPSLAKTVQLPHPGETCQLAWPPVDVSFGIAAADMVYNAMASRSAAFSPDWHEAKKLDDQRKIAEWTRRNELLERQQEESKREYIAAQKAAAKGK